MQALDACSKTADQAGDDPLEFLSTEEPRATDWLRRALVRDVATDVETAIERPAVAPRRDVGHDPAFPQIHALHALTEGDGVDPRSVPGAVILDCIATARAVAWGYVPWWMLVPPFVLLFVFSRAMGVHRRIRAATSALFDAAFPKGDDAANERRKAARAALRRRERSIGLAGREPGVFVGSRRGSEIVAFLEEPLAAAGWEVPEAPASVVVSEDERRAFDESRGKQGRRRARITTALAKEREARIQPHARAA